jgi:hypothetical protein
MGFAEDVSSIEHLDSGSSDMFVYLVNVYNCNICSFTGVRIIPNATVTEGWQRRKGIISQNLSKNEGAHFTSPREYESNTGCDHSDKK